MAQMGRKRSIPKTEITLRAVRSSGPGGQNVNKTSTKVELRWDITKNESLPVEVKNRICALKKPNKEGEIILTSDQFRSQDRNIQDCFNKLDALIAHASVAPKKRTQTKPSRNSKKKRVDQKVKRGQTKRLRGRVDHD